MEKFRSKRWGISNNHSCRRLGPINEPDPNSRSLHKQPMPDARSSNYASPQSPLDGLPSGPAHTSSNTELTRKAQRPRRQRKLPSSKNDITSPERHQSLSPRPFHGDSGLCPPHDYSNSGAARDGGIEAKPQPRRTMRQPQHPASLTHALPPPMTPVVAEDCEGAVPPPMQPPQQQQPPKQHQPPPKQQQPPKQQLTPKQHHHQLQQDQQQQPPQSNQQHQQPPSHSVMAGWDLAGEKPQRNAVYRLIRKTELQQHYHYRTPPDITADPSLSPTSHTPTSTPHQEHQPMGLDLQQRTGVKAGPRKTMPQPSENLTKPGPNPSKEEIPVSRLLQPLHRLRTEPKTESRTRSRSSGFKTGSRQVGDDGEMVVPLMYDQCDVFQTGHPAVDRVVRIRQIAMRRRRRHLAHGQGQRQGQGGEWLDDSAGGASYATGGFSSDGVILVTLAAATEIEPAVLEEPYDGLPYGRVVEDVSAAATGIGPHGVKRASAYEDITSATGSSSSRSSSGSSSSNSRRVMVGSSSGTSNATGTSSSLLREALMSDLALMNPVYRMIRKHELRQRHQPTHGSVPAPSGLAVAAATDPWGDDAFADVMLGGLMLPPPAAVHAPIPTQTTATTTSVYGTLLGAQAAPSSSHNSSAAGESPDEGPMIKKRSGDSRRRNAATHGATLGLALHHSSSSHPPLTQPSWAGSGDGDCDGGEENVVDDQAALDPADDDRYKSQRSGFGLNPVLRLIRKKQLQQRLRRRGRLVGPQVPASIAGSSPPATATATAMAAAFNNIGATRSSSHSTNSSSSTPDTTTTTATSSNASTSSSSDGPGGAFRVWSGVGDVGVSAGQEAGRYAGSSGGGSSGEDGGDGDAGGPYVLMEGKGGMREGGGEWAIGPEDAVGGRAVMNPVYRLIRKKLLLSRRAHRTTLSAAPPPPTSTAASAAATPPSAPTPPTASGSSAPLLSVTFAPSPKPPPRSCGPRAPFFDLELPLLATEPNTAAVNGGSQASANGESGGAAATATAAAAGPSSVDVGGEEPAESRQKSAMLSSDNLKPGRSDGGAAGEGTLDVGGKGLVEGTSPPLSRLPSPTPMTGMPQSTPSPPTQSPQLLVSDRLAERLVGERSHMNQVYRLIRKKELQLRRLQSAAAAAPSELPMTTGMVRQAPADESYGSGGRQRTAIGPVGWADPPALLHPFELEAEEEMGGQLSAPSSYDMLTAHFGTAAAAAPSSLRSFSRLFLDSTYDDEFEDEYDNEAVSAGDFAESLTAADDEGTFWTSPADDVDDEVADNDAVKYGTGGGPIGNTTDPRVTWPQNTRRKNPPREANQGSIRRASDAGAAVVAAVEAPLPLDATPHSPSQLRRRRGCQPKVAPEAAEASTATGAIVETATAAVAPTGISVSRRKKQADPAAAAAAAAAGVGAGGGGVGAPRTGKAKRGRKRKSDDQERHAATEVTPRRRRIQELKASLRAKLLLLAASDSSTASAASPPPSSALPSQALTAPPATAPDSHHPDPHLTVGGYFHSNSINRKDPQFEDPDVGSDADRRTAQQQNDIRSAAGGVVNLAVQTEAAVQVRQQKLPSSQPPQLTAKNERLQASTAHPLSWQVARRAAATAVSDTAPGALATTAATAAAASSGARGVNTRRIASQPPGYPYGHFGLLGFLRDTNYTDADAGTDGDAGGGGGGVGEGGTGNNVRLRFEELRNRNGDSDGKRSFRSGSGVGVGSDVGSGARWGSGEAQPQRKPLRFSGIAQLWQSAGLRVGPPVVAPGQQLERRLAQVGVTAGVAARLAASAPVLTRGWGPAEVLSRLQGLQHLLTGAGSSQTGAGSSTTGAGSSKTPSRGASTGATATAKGTGTATARLTGAKGNSKGDDHAQSDSSGSMTAALDMNGADKEAAAAAHSARRPSQLITAVAAAAVGARVHGVGRDAGRDTGRDQHDSAAGSSRPDPDTDRDVALAAVAVAKQPNLLTRQPAALEANLNALATALGVDRHAAQALARTWPSLLELRATSLPGRLAALASELGLGPGAGGGAGSGTSVHSCGGRVGEEGTATAAMTTTATAAMTLTTTSSDSFDIIMRNEVALDKTANVHDDVSAAVTEPAVTELVGNNVAVQDGDRAATALAASVVRRYPPALALTQGAVAARVMALEQAIEHGAHTSASSSSIHTSTSSATSAALTSSPWPRARALQLILAHPGLLGYSPVALGARWRALMVAVTAAEEEVMAGRQQPIRPSGAVSSAVTPFPAAGTNAATDPGDADTAATAAAAATAAPDSGRDDGDETDRDAAGAILPWRAQLLSGPPSAAARCLAASEARLQRLSYVASLLAAAVDAAAAEDDDNAADAKATTLLPDFTAAAVATSGAATMEQGNVGSTADGVDATLMKRRGRPRKFVLVSEQQLSPSDAAWRQSDGGSGTDAIWEPVQRGSNGCLGGGVTVIESSVTEVGDDGDGGAARWPPSRGVDIVSISTTLSMTNEKFEKRYPGFEGLCRRQP